MYDDPSLDDLKRAVLILPLAVSSGLAPRKIGGGEYVVRCPFGKHEDTTPSCHINHHKNVFHCKGCGEKGTVLDWLMLTENLDVAGAIKRLKEEYLKIRSITQQVEIVEKQPEPINILEPRFQKALGLVVDYCHNNFKSKKEGASFMLKRGIIYGEIVEDFKIGLSDGSLAHVVNDPEILKSLVELGILKAEENSSNGGLKEHFAGRVIFPILDENGLIIQIYGRNIFNTGSKHMLLGGVPLALFNPKALISSELILCESVIDALSIMAMGYRNVVASLSANGLKDNLLERIISSGVRKVFIAFDNDNAGNTAASSLSEKFIEHKIESFRIIFDENSDANDLLRKSENIDSAKGKMKELLEKADPLKQVLDTVQSVGYHTDTLTKKGKEYLYKIGQREYTIRGLDQNKSDSALKIFLKLSIEDKFHIDNNLDLFNSKGTGIFTRAAGQRLVIDERVIRSDLDLLTVKLDEILKKTIEEKENQKTENKKEFHKNIETSFKGREFLRLPLFIVQFIKDVEACGLVGEALNFFFAYLASLTKGMDHQIHVIIQSESSSGKSTLLNLLSKFIPEEDSIYFTQITPRSLYYGPEGFLKNKCILIAEADGLKEAEYAIKQLMSEGFLAISYTRTDPKTGENTADMKTSFGPVQFTLTEPVEGLHEEIENRCVILIMDVTPEQTERIQKLQRLLQSPEGVSFRREKEKLCDFYRHVQRELKVYPIVNDYSKYLIYDTANHQSRRDHQKYLTIMNSITMLFQYQREKIYKDGVLCIKTHIIDVVLSHFIARRIFAKSLDELPAQTRNFAAKVTEHYKRFAKTNQLEFDQVWCYRKDMREITGLSNSRTHEHANRMVEFEYLTTRRDQNGIAYRFIVEPTTSGHFKGALKLAPLTELLRHASKKERQEYESFKGYLEEIFKALEPAYEGGEI